MITSLKTITKDQAKTIVSHVVNNMGNVPFIEQRGGCGRCYVSIGYDKLTKSSAIGKELIANGFKLTKRPYSSNLYIYVGYDNGTSHEWSKAERIASLFKESGVVAYCDGDSD